MRALFFRHRAEPEPGVDLRAMQAELDYLRQSVEGLRKDLDRLQARFGDVAAAADAVADGAQFLRNATRQVSERQAWESALDRRLAALESARPPGDGQ